MTARIISTPSTLGGEARFDGTRVHVEKVLELLAAGVAPAEVLLMIPHLPEGWLDLLAALRPVLRNRYRRALADALDPVKETT